METIRKCGSGKSISIWILLYFSMEYQKGVDRGNSPNKRHFALQSAYLAKDTPAKSGNIHYKNGWWSKEDLQKFCMVNSSYNIKRQVMKMEKNLQLITKPEELMAWLNNNDLLLTLDEKEAKILLGYLEGHDYAIGINDGKMVRVDICDENYECEDYSIDEFIDTACEWNYDLMTGAKRDMENAENHAAFQEAKEYFKRLRADEKVLDKMFAKTCYGKKLYDVCAKMAQGRINKMNDKEKGMQEAEQRRGR